MGHQTVMEEQRADEASTENEARGLSEVKIATRVIAKIAATVIRDVRGVHLTSPSPRFVSAIFDRDSTQVSAIRTRIHQGKEVTVNICVSADFGLNLLEAVGDLERRLQAAIRTMTGFRTKKITVNVVDLIVPAEADEPESAMHGAGESGSSWRR